MTVGRRLGSVIVSLLGSPTKHSLKLGYGFSCETQPIPSLTVMCASSITILIHQTFCTINCVAPTKKAERVSRRAVVERDNRIKNAT